MNVIAMAISLWIGGLDFLAFCAFGEEVFHSAGNSQMVKNSPSFRCYSLSLCLMRMSTQLLILFL